MSETSTVDLKRSLLKNYILLELDRYRYLPLHLAVLYLKLCPSIDYFLIGDYTLTSAVPKDSGINTSPNRALGLNLIHKDQQTPSPWRDTITLGSMKLRTPPYASQLDIFKTPFYPGRGTRAVHIADEIIEKETDIIYARNRNLATYVASLVTLEADNHIEGLIPFHLIVPYLFLNKDRTIIRQRLGVGKELMQYDQQNISIKLKNLQSGGTYGKNFKDHKEFIGMFDLFIALNKNGHREDRGDDLWNKFDRFSLP